ncbi:MAG TPA: amino acid permease [Thermoanaerobaculia bacterium]|nr:amino acid permease [Thermoanaerobaculia bacterium]
MTELKRDIGLWRGIALNMIDMVGIGPFITIPFILTALGGGRGMLAWILGGLLAISDGLVTAELASELPASGGSYVFLRESYGRAGRWISFLFLFQILFSAPLSMASGCIGFANYLAPLFKELPRVEIIATAVCLITTVLLLRRIEAVGKFSVLLWIGVLLTLAIVIAAGLPHLRLAAFEFWRAPRLDNQLGFAGLGVALIYSVYDYLGYYNICYLGDEVRDAERTIPRVIVISILVIGVIYLVMNACIVSVLPMKQAMTSKAVVSDYIGVLFGKRGAAVISILILWTAFASIFSLMLGYSRVLYAAARDGNFFRIFSRLHATEAHPYVSTLFLGCVAAIFCWFPLSKVLQAILSIRAIIPFMAQIAGAVILRQRDPDRRRPFKMWLYPLPAIVALGLWTYIVVSPQKGLKVGGLYVIAAGTLFYFARNWLMGRQTSSRTTNTSS